MSNGMQYVGEFLIERLTITSSKTGATESLTGTGQYQLDMYESIYNNAVTAKLTIVDDNNILSNLPILGQEIIDIKIKTAGLEEFSITKQFVVYEISGRSEFTRGTEVFTLNLVSLEFLQGMRTVVSGSYTDTISNIVKSILTDSEILGYDPSKVFIDKTVGIRKFVFPNSHPDIVIERLATESIPEGNKGAPFFMFFESLDGVHFENLINMYKSNTVQEFHSGDAILLSGAGLSKLNDFDEEMKRIISMSVSSQNNMMANISEGMLGSKMIEYNIFTKSYETVTYNYFDDFDKYDRISDDMSENNPVYMDTNVPGTQKRISDYSDASLHLHPTSSYNSMDAQSYSKNKKMLYNPNQIKSTFLDRQAKYAELDTTSEVVIRTNGHSAIRVGNPVIFNRQVIGRDHGDEDINSLYSGKFLIAKARHIFDIPNKKYETILSLIKDSSPAAH